MRLFTKATIVLIFSTLTLVATSCFASEDLFRQARQLQREGHWDKAIDTYKNYLVSPFEVDSMSENQLAIYTDALVQMMNTFQSKGEPETCISALEEVFKSSPILQNECLRDFYSVMGYALSRTENSDKAEEITLKALTLPLHKATPERYFRDYAYAAAVFYSNPEFMTEVINWCEEALHQAQLSRNTSGQQWVMAMLGSLYKRSGDLNGALELYQESIEDSRSKDDDLGVVNSLSSLVDLFLYWDIPEYADIYATEAVGITKKMTRSNPMVSAQAFINKGRALHKLGHTDSISLYIAQARELCEALPYNSGMVDIDLLNGICLTENGTDSLESGIKHLQRVIQLGTSANRAKAYHQLAQTYLKYRMDQEAEIMLDSLYQILNRNDFQDQILHLGYEPILDHYLKNADQPKIKQYVEMMFNEQNAFKNKSINYNLVEAIVDLQTGKRLQELKIGQLKQENHRLWMLVFIIGSVIAIATMFALFLYQRNKYVKRIRYADRQLASLIERYNRLNDEKEKISQEVKALFTNKNNRQEFETLTPYVLKQSGEIKFRQNFELLYPLFLSRLREKVPSVSRREELLSMLIALKQDNKNIAELLAIAPRSVLMLRHRFRQKIGMDTEYSLENFIENLLHD